jgi:EmrB/QacA subfamily drug resistance transporter
VEHTKQTASFRLMLSAIFLGNFLAVLSISTISVAIPVVMEDFQAPLSTVQWLMAGYMLATGIVAPVVGYFGDQFSYKRLFILALSGFTLFSFLCVVAWDIQILILFRIIQGIFGGMIIPITMTIIYQVVERDRQSHAMGLWSLASMLAPVIGPTLGGWMVDAFGWKSIFTFNIPLGIFAIFLVLKCIPYYRLEAKRSFDLFGFITVVLCSSFLLLAFSQGSSWGWSSLPILLLMGIGFLALGLFIWWELRIKTPLLQLRVFSFSRFTHSLVINCIVTISMYAGTLLLPLFLQNALQLSPMDTGIIMLPGAIVMAAAAPIVGMLYDKVGPFKLIMSGILLIAVSTGFLSHIGVETSVYLIAFYQVVRCIGIALCNMPLTNSGMKSVTMEYMGHASSITNWTRQCLASLSIAIFSSLVVMRTDLHAAMGVTDPFQATALGIDDVFWIGTLIAVIAIPLTFLLRKKEDPLKGTIALEKEKGKDKAPVTN